MNQTKKKQLLKSLETEIKKAQEMAQKRKKAADEFRSASRSQQGDRLYFEDANHLAQGYLSRLLKFKKEVELAPNIKPEKLKSVSFITLQYRGGGESSFYFTQKSLRLLGLQIVSADSPLGKAIAGKKEGESFSYQVEKEGQKSRFSGKIKKIE